MKKKLALISLALACLTAAPLASAETWKYNGSGRHPVQFSTEGSAWKIVNNINTLVCSHGIYAGKYSPKYNTSTCASAPIKVGNSWQIDMWHWAAI
jgi:hypothetical protein